MCLQVLRPWVVFREQTWEVATAKQKTLAFALSPGWEKAAQFHLWSACSLIRRAYL